MGKRSVWVLAALSLGLPGLAMADACDEVDCDGHGTCMIERDAPFCLCEDGYAADGTTCIEAPAAEVDLAARRTSSVAARIVYIAAHEGGRSPRDIGRDRDDPGPLREFMEIGSLWCSDFVSWVYRAAGVPFTGGYAGGWLLTNNYAIREWFRRQDRWVDRDSEDWEEFRPRPGDYVRFDTRTYGHSAIVRYVLGDTLYTIEGNARGGMVRLRMYPRYREYRRLDGFGIVTEPEPRVAARHRLHN